MAYGLQDILGKPIWYANEISVEFGSSLENRISEGSEQVRREGAIWVLSFQMLKKSALITDGVLK